MKILKLFAAALAALSLPGCGGETGPASEEITRVEPPFWWAGMKTELQIMVKGDGISAYDAVKITGKKGVSVKAVHKADSPNYLFIDVNVGAKARPGMCTLVFSNGEGDKLYWPYEIKARENGSANRKSFTTEDMIYLIMPDRFANGDPGNDTCPGVTEPLLRSHPSGRHGGDIQGIIDHLDYIAGLGATAIWPTPLLEDNDSFCSYHGYACSDYYNIDPRYGTNELYCEMVEEAHARGLKVILDVVTNHCGITHWWMKDLPFKDWIHTSEEYQNTNHVFSLSMDPNASCSDFKIMQEGWFVPTMPDMNLDNPFMLKYFQQWAVWWIEYSGLDGLRVDTFYYNDKDAMPKWCQAVLKEYPGLNIVGECWNLNPDMVAYWQGGNPNADGFDSHLPSIMDFPLREAINDALAPGGDIRLVYDALSHDFIYHDLSKMLLFFSNHDAARIADIVAEDPGKMKIALTLLATMRGIPQLFYGDEMMFSTGNPVRDDGRLRMDFPGGWMGDKVDLFTPEGRAAAAALAASAASTTPAPAGKGVAKAAGAGAPSGAGTAVSGAGTAGPAAAGPAAVKEPMLSAYANAAELHDYTATLFNWRKGSSAVKHGKTLHFLPEDNTYGYFRYDSAETVFVFINNSSVPAHVPWTRFSEITSRLGQGTNVLTGTPCTVSDSTVVPPNSTLIVDFKQ